MIIYNSTKFGFLEDVLTNDIENIILKEFKKNGRSYVQTNELQSWKNSLMYMDKILADDQIPRDCGVSIEYHIPQTSKRVDFILTGQDDSNNDYAIIIELKQWSTAELTEKDAIVRTVINRGLREAPHPSYQAWSYATLLQGFNQTVYEENVQLKPCAYLHNYTPDGIITHDHYQEYIKKAPVFLKPDALSLREFIKRYLKKGDTSRIMYRIEHGKIRPSKALSDSVASMLKGNSEFVLIDDQKIVYEQALALAKQSGAENKKVLIVEGGPGTGKSVVAINLLVELTRIGLVAQYVSKNSAPRAVYQSKLTGSLKKSEIGFLFKGSGTYVGSKENELDVLIVDEAHRLNEKSGLYRNLGENQVKEIIRSSKCALFFIDEDQKVTLEDIGTKEEITRWAQREGASVENLELSSQFRCNGADGYLAWLDNTLQIRETSNVVLDTKEYDFRILSSPTELKDLIFEKNLINNKARMVAGYCWDWVSKKNSKLFDITFPECGFAAQWNLSKDGSLWIISPDSVNEVGCIHTCQGLEVDYIGVIIGPDLIVRNGIVLTDPSKRSKMDSSIKGYKKLMEKSKEETQKVVKGIIKNTYRTLMTRGMKGCYVYCCDKETEDYFRNYLSIS
jgi:DUF2075 family protein